MSGERSTRRILLVDDDAGIRAILARFLSNPLWTVDAAESGQQALSKFRAATYDAVLVDIEMPDMSGFDVIRQLRALELPAGAARATIVAFSAYSDDDSRARARAAGSDRYVVKPATQRVIVEAVMGAEAEASGVMDADILALLPAFLEDNQREVRDLERALATGNFDQARAIAHRLRGSFQVYGFTDAASVCAEIESHATSGSANSLAAARGQIPMLYAHLHHIQARIRTAPQAE